MADILTNSIHPEPHPLAGTTATLSTSIPRDPDRLAGSEVHVEDWYDRIAGRSWMVANGNFAALKYAMRSAIAGLPLDNEVVGVKVGGYSHIVHTSELGGDT